MTLKLQPGHRRDGRLIVAPIEDMLAPKPGRIVRGPRWWAVTPNEEVLFQGDYSAPHCNTSKEAMEYVAKSLSLPVSDFVYLEMTFVPHE